MLWPILLSSLGIALAIQVVMFIPAFIFRTDKLTDLSYGLTFIILALISLLLNDLSLSKIILFAMILAWGLRLAAYLFIRISKIKKDDRFDKIRGSFFKFLGFWVLQGVTVWAIMLPSLLLINSEARPLAAASFIGLGIWLCGLLIEAIADHQKFTFKNNPANKGKFIQSGLWKYSRHPNYFGEMLCWSGIYIYALPVLAASTLTALLGLISPLYIITILRFVTGVPKLEKHDSERYPKEFAEYKKKTSMIILWPPKKK